MKECSKCGQEKPLSEFYTGRYYKGGLSSRCKKCHNSYSKEYWQNHKKRTVRCQREYRQTIVGYLRAVFSNMKQRCTNPKTHNYNRYGGRGIELRFVVNEFIDYVCNDLQVDPRGLDIDRIDNNGHYQEGNIRFVTRMENSRNKGRSK